MGILAAGLAHELNNPIGSILLAARNAKAAPERVDECLDTILRNARRCAAVVRNVLLVARTDPAGRDRVEAGAVVRAAVDAASETLAERRAAVHVELDETLPAIEANAVELEQALTNLLRNAAESGDGVEVRIRATARAGAVHVVVTDDGRGIPPEDESRVFEPFFTTRQAEGGTGLGLSLARAIVAAHGGSIELSGAPGRGTRVEVVLPRREGENT